MKRQLLAALLLHLVTAQGDELAVITHPDSALKITSAKQVANIFLKKIQLDATGQALIALNLPAQHPVRVAFSKQIFNKPPDALEDYWNIQYFQGISPPYVLVSEEEMLRFVASTHGAIGYALTCHVDNRVRIVWHLELDESLNKSCELK